MAKRFTEVNKWRDPWFCALSPEMKLFWFYVVDNCDPAGVWEIDFARAKYETGIVYDPEKVLGVFHGRIEKLDDRFWFIPAFVNFQYKNLSNNNHYHKPVYESLVKHGLIGRMFRSQVEKKQALK